MDPEQLQAAIAAIKEGSGDDALAILEAMLIGGASSEVQEAAAEPAPTDASALASDTDEPAEEEKPSALSAALRAATGATSDQDVLAHFVTLSAKVDKLETDSAALELTTRRGLIAQLVKCNAETPATAWEGKPEDRNPCKRLSAEPIADLRVRVDAMSKAPGARANLVAPDVTKHELSARQKRITSSLTPGQLVHFKELSSNFELKGARS